MSNNTLNDLTTVCRKFITILLYLWLCALILGKDPCSSYIELSDADRELRFTKETGKSDRDDLEAGVWYRITGKAGYKMANRYPQNWRHHCLQILF